MMMRQLATALILGFAVTAIACGSGTSPVSPAPVAQTADADQQTASAESVSLTGVVQRLDVTSRAFSLSARTGSRIVRADDQTEVWSGGTRVRFGTLQIGMTVGIRGLDYRSFVLARTIAIMR